MLRVGPLLTLASPVGAPASKDSAIGKSSKPALPPFSSKLLSRRPPQDLSSDLPGQTTTLLPDGSLLNIGGLAGDGPVTAVVVPARSEIKGDPVHIQRARAWHTATMLPNGNILILGGIGGQTEKWPTVRRCSIQKQERLMNRNYNMLYFSIDNVLVIDFN